MRTDKWIERGLNSLQAGQWFDGIQLLQGAQRRAIRLNQPDKVKEILRKSSDSLFSEQQNEIFCHFILDTLLLIGKKSYEKEWFEILPMSLILLRKGKLQSCTTKFLNRLISSKYFLDPKVIKNLHLLISEQEISNETKEDIFYCIAGLRISKKEYLKCYEVLSEWNEINPSSNQVLAYLTLAELNAFEIDSCGKFLDRLKMEKKPSRYTETVLQVFKAVELGDHDLFKSIVEDNKDLVNLNKDALFKLLCDGIADFLKPKGSKGLLNLFGGQ